MKVGLVQQAASANREENVTRGLAALETAARQGAALVAFAELAFERFHPQHPAPADPLALAETVPGPTTERFMRVSPRSGVLLVPCSASTGRRGW